MSEAITMVDDFASFRTLLAGHGVAVESLRARDDGTLGASSPTLLAERPGARPTDATTAVEALELGALLGRGGMGEVHLAKQRSLRREVAVKTVLDAGSADAQTALLKEAWAGGALEHPSVVPVHTLTRIDGAAAVVMKRIAGASWASVLAHPDAHPRFSGEGALEAHLRVFVQVCHAIAFAHERGILHLDLKPENVMVGDLGEVYVLDWGLAAATEKGPAWLPRARAMSLPAGTPGYMAPELAGAFHDQVGTATDVYLLGSLLHHVVTGSYRHHGDNLLATLLRAYLDDPPPYGPEVPRGLAEILTRAMQREASDRWPSADAMREAVEAFLRHRPAEHFMARAEATLAELEARLGKPAKGDEAAEIEPLLAECEVALAEVRREWAEHPGLAAAEDALVARRALHAIVEERLEAARALVRELKTPPESLARALADLERRVSERERYEQGLEQIERELDFSLGTGERRRIFGVFGALWALVSIGLGAMHRSHTMSFGYHALLIECGLLVAVLVPFAWLRRAQYLANRANRRLWGGLTFVAFAVETFFGAAWLAHVRVEVAVAITPILYAFGFATLGMAIDRRILSGVPPLLAAAALAALLPDYAFDVVGLGGGLAAFMVLQAWRVAKA